VIIGYSGFRQSLKTLVPKWLQDRPGFRVGFSVLYSFAALLDFVFQQAFEGFSAPWPGYGTPTALPLIGQNRGMIQGETETVAAFSARLISWLVAAENSGSSELLVSEIQAYIGNTPTVRVVDRSGNWVSIAPNGAITKVAAGSAAWVWDWDSLSNPERNVPSRPWWSDLWIIITPSEWAVTGTNLAALAAIWPQSNGNGVGLGFAITRTAVDAISQIVSYRKGAHTYVEAIIFSFDATLFDPNTVNSGNPNGTWGYWAYSATRGGTLIPTRSASARYMIPTRGG